jgi:hypothetical protein
VDVLHFLQQEEAKVQPDMPPLITMAIQLAHIGISSPFKAKDHPKITRKRCKTAMMANKMPAEISTGVRQQQQHFLSSGLIRTLHRNGWRLFPPHSFENSSFGKTADFFDGFIAPKG